MFRVLAQLVVSVALFGVLSNCLAVEPAADSRVTQLIEEIQVIGKREKLSEMRAVIIEAEDIVLLIWV